MVYHKEDEELEERTDRREDGRLGAGRTSGSMHIGIFDIWVFLSMGQVAGWT